jgi:hypothetical protein
MSGFCLKELGCAELSAPLFDGLITSNPLPPCPEDECKDC